MGRKSIREREVRKITRLGKTSLAVTIPIEIVYDLGWKEKQKVVVRRKGNSVIIDDWEE